MRKINHKKRHSFSVSFSYCFFYFQQFYIQDIHQLLGAKHIDHHFFIAIFHMDFNYNFNICWFSWYITSKVPIFFVSLFFFIF